MTDFQPEHNHAPVMDIVLEHQNRMDALTDDHKETVQNMALVGIRIFFAYFG